MDFLNYQNELSNLFQWWNLLTTCVDCYLDYPMNAMKVIDCFRVKMKHLNLWTAWLISYIQASNLSFLFISLKLKIRKHKTLLLLVC